MDCQVSIRAIPLKNKGVGSAKKLNSGGGGAPEKLNIGGGGRSSNSRGGGALKKLNSRGGGCRNFLPTHAPLIFLNGIALSKLPSGHGTYLYYVKTPTNWFLAVVCDQRTSLL